MNRFSDKILQSLGVIDEPISAYEIEYTPSSVLSSRIEQMLQFSEYKFIVFQLMMRTFLVFPHIIDNFLVGDNRIGHKNHISYRMTLQNLQIFSISLYL